jgi:hypothetical protein
MTVESSATWVSRMILFLDAMLLLQFLRPGGALIEPAWRRRVEMLRDASRSRACARLRDARSNPNSPGQNFVAYATKVRQEREREWNGHNRECLRGWGLADGEAV